ncbi:MAG TPA: 16S rRNA processing protein RimM, partial [Paludibacteraceae bacterium]|nr:16S rRNA processing protein RimM [Paludibacteraceae bacterium]
HKKFLNILESDVDMDNNTFIEFRIFDKDNNFIGIVTDIDTSTQNVLFIVDNGEKQILIPACQDYILQIDEMKKIIYMDLPEGLLEL